MHNPKRKKSDGDGRGNAMMGRLPKGCNKAMKAGSETKIEHRTQIALFRQLKFESWVRLLSKFIATSPN